MIEVRGLTKYYGDIAAIQDVTFDVAKGEVLGFLGPNAAGKTTTMRILTGYIPPSAGTVTVAGHDISKNSLDVRRHIGYLPESVSLYHEMTVCAYLDFLGKLRGLRATKKRKTRVDDVMALCQVSHMADRSIGKLSKGYRQRVGLAQALVHDPDVLILDEPTTGLDPAQIIEVRDLIRDLGKEHTIILSTHILSEVEHVCQRIMIINEGNLVAEDSREQLRSRLKGAEQVYLEIAGASPQTIISDLSVIEHVRDVQSRPGGGYDVICTLGMDLRAELAARIVGNGWQLLELRPDGLSLEEIFLKLTQDEGIV